MEIAGNLNIIDSRCSSNFERKTDNFNQAETSGLSNVIVPCLTKLGQNVFSSETEPFIKWLDSLNENALYKELLNAHTATDL